MNEIILILILLAPLPSPEPAEQPAVEQDAGFDDDAYREYWRNWFAENRRKVDHAR